MAKQQNVCLYPESNIYQQRAALICQRNACRTTGMYRTRTALTRLAIHASNFFSPPSLYTISSSGAISLSLVLRFGAAAPLAEQRLAFAMGDDYDGVATTTFILRVRDILWRHSPLCDVAQ